MSSAEATPLQITAQAYPNPHCARRRRTGADARVRTSPSTLFTLSRRERAREREQAPAGCLIRPCWRVRRTAASRLRRSSSAGRGAL
eukprot:3625762-Pleurochrysis_carterae.AAC.1